MLNLWVLPLEVLFFPCQINQMELSESKVKQPFGFSSVKKKESESIVQKKLQTLSIFENGSNHTTGGCC